MTSHTGLEDKSYNLVSILYHSLSGADSCAKYAQDAKQSGDDQLAGFFDEAMGQYRMLAQKAKELTKSNL